VILVDTSVWVWRLRSSIVRGVSEGDELAICPPVVQELRQGASSAGRIAEVDSIMMHAEMIESPVRLGRFDEAGAIYSRARRRGFTIRSAMDCLIAAIAIHHDLTLMHGDRDFEVIARVAPLRTRNVLRVSPSE
jgi:predicted nucleic acid-binding protein